MVIRFSTLSTATEIEDCINNIQKYTLFFTEALRIDPQVLWATFLSLDFSLVALCNNINV